MFGCSEEEIAAQADALALRKNKSSPGFRGSLKMPRWTREEEILLESLYPSTPNISLARRFGRSARAISDKANHMGLGKSDQRRAAMGRENVALRKDRR